MIRHPSVVHQGRLISILADGVRQMLHQAGRADCLGTDNCIRTRIGRADAAQNRLNLGNCGRKIDLAPMMPTWRKTDCSFVGSQSVTMRAAAPEGTQDASAPATAETAVHRSGKRPRSVRRSAGSHQPSTAAQAPVRSRSEAPARRLRATCRPRRSALASSLPAAQQSARATKTVRSSPLVLRRKSWNSCWLSNICSNTETSHSSVTTLAFLDGGPLHDALQHPLQVVGMPSRQADDPLDSGVLIVQHGLYRLHNDLPRRPLAQISQADAHVPVSSSPAVGRSNPIDARTVQVFLQTQDQGEL